MAKAEEKPGQGGTEATAELRLWSLDQRGHLESKAVLGISATKVLSLYSSSLPLNQICLYVCPLTFLLTIQWFLPIFSSTNSRKGITLAYQIIILYVWTIFFLPCHVRGQWSSYSIFPRPFSANDNWWDSPQGGCSNDRLSKGNLWYSSNGSSMSI